ncbi:MAG: magnesium transporter [Actinomycetia bacterium]|nr:magnesium transporter [Actinomycetes bacterium]
MKIRFRRPAHLGTAIRELARRKPVEAEEYLDSHQDAWEQIAGGDPHEAADILEALDEEGAADLLKDLDLVDAGDVLDQMQPKAAADVIEELDPDDAAALISEMETDQAVDLIGALDPDEREAVLDALDPATAADVQTLLHFAPDTAGGMMTTDVASLPAGLTSGEAIEALRRLHDELGANLRYVYVVDEEHRLTGVVPFRELVFARPHIGLEDIMDHNVAMVRTDTDREEVAELIQKYTLIALPVVDDEGRLVGMVKVAEAIEAIQAEAGEDIALMFGAGEQESVFTPVRESVRRRLPWNLVNLAAGFITVFVVAQFQDTLARYALLAAFMPLVAGLSGNSGAQAIAVTIRSLAVNELPPGREARAVRRELIVGVVRGAVIASVGAALVAFTVAVFASDGGTGANPSPQEMAVIIWVSMMIGAVTAALAGASIPLLLRRLNQDPAMASNIFLTMITDAVGFGSFLLIATWLL